MRHRPAGRLRVWWWRLRAREACLDAGRHWVLRSTQACLWFGALCHHLAASQAQANDGSSPT